MSSRSSFMACLRSLHFTETVEEFEDRIMQKKMKIPKMSLKNSGNSVENSFGEERMPLRHKKVGCQDDRHPQLLSCVVTRILPPLA